MVQLLPSNSERVDDIVRALCNREGDTTGVNFLKYKGVALDVWRELNLTKVRHTRRILLAVDKRTNTVQVPPADYLHWASLSGIDRDGRIQPLLLNTNLTHDIVDIAAPHEGGCEHEGCASRLCSQIKSYESIQQVTDEALPNGGTQPFTSTTRKRLDPDGRYYEERTVPVRTHDAAGNWTGMELQTTTETLCHLEVDERGCACDTPANRERVCVAGCADDFAVEAGCPGTPAAAHTYNVTEQGDRLVFPSDFAYEQVLLRYYVNPTGRTLLVPLVAKEAMIAGIKHYTVPFKKRPVLWEIQFWEKKWLKAKERTGRILNRHSLAEWYAVLTPKKDMV